MSFAESIYTLGLLRTVIFELGTQYLGASWSAIQLPIMLVGLAHLSRIDYHYVHSIMLIQSQLTSLV